MIFDFISFFILPRHITGIGIPQSPKTPETSSIPYRFNELRLPLVKLLLQMLFESSKLILKISFAAPANHIPLMPVFLPRHRLLLRQRKLL